MTGEKVTLTTEDQKLLERALMASTEKLYDLAEPDVASSLATQIMALDWKARKDWDIDEQADRHGELQEMIDAALAPILAEKERAEADARVFKINATSKLRSLEARALAAEAALEPFASYHEDSELLDNEGAPLPDEQHAGYVYLTMGDFRRAKAALAQIAVPGAAMEAP